MFVIYTKIKILNQLGNKISFLFKLYQENEMEHFIKESNGANFRRRWDAFYTYKLPLDQKI